MKSRSGARKLSQTRVMSYELDMKKESKDQGKEEKPRMPQIGDKLINDGNWRKIKSQDTEKRSNARLTGQ